MITRRDWYVGVAVLAAALVFHALFPRYDWRQRDALLLRVDRWTGQVHAGFVNAGTPRWTPLGQ